MRTRPPLNIDAGLALALGLLMAFVPAPVHGQGSTSTEIVPALEPEAKPGSETSETHKPEADDGVKIIRLGVSALREGGYLSLQGCSEDEGLGFGRYSCFGALYGEDQASALVDLSLELGVRYQFDDTFSAHLGSQISATDLIVWPLVGLFYLVSQRHREDPSGKEEHDGGSSLPPFPLFPLRVMPTFGVEAGFPISDSASVRVGADVSYSVPLLEGKAANWRVPTGLIGGLSVAVGF